MSHQQDQVLNNWQEQVLITTMGLLAYFNKTINIWNVIITNFVRQAGGNSILLFN